MSTWYYPRCYVTEVYDGDTIKVDIDLGQDLWVRDRAVRLAGIAARELREPGGREARDHLRALLPPDIEVAVVSTGWDKYAGRIDGLVGRPDGGDVGALMIAAGYAVAWNGKGAQPRPAWPIGAP